MTAAPPTTVLFTCAGGAGGWSILRSLESNPAYRLVGVDGDPLSAGLYQPGLAARYVAPMGDEPGYIDAILDIAAAEDATLAWPTSDEEVVAMSAAAERMRAAGVTPIVADIATVRRSIDKPAMVERMDRAGVPVPLTASLDADLSVFDGPTIVRPKTARGGKGVAFFDGREDLERYRDAVGADAGTLFVQERIPNVHGDMHLYAALMGDDRTRRALFMSRSIRTAYAWGGPAHGGVPVDDPRLRELGERVIAASGPWRGPVNVEFLYDARRDDFVFVEVNPRYWGYSYLATAAGVNFPDLTLRLFLGETYLPVERFRTDVVTMTSREQIAVPRDIVQGPIPMGTRK